MLLGGFTPLKFGELCCGTFQSNSGDQQQPVLPARLDGRFPAQKFTKTAQNVNCQNNMI